MACYRNGGCGPYEMLKGFTAEEIYEAGKWLEKGFKDGFECSTVSTDVDEGDAELAECLTTSRESIL